MQVLIILPTRNATSTCRLHHPKAKALRRIKRRSNKGLTLSHANTPDEAIAMPRNSRPPRKHLTGRTGTNPAKTPHYISLREAGAILINPANPAAAYAELESAVARTFQVFVKARRISYAAGTIALLSAARCAYYLVGARAVPFSALSAALFALALLIFVGFHPITIRKTLIGRFLVPPAPEPISDLLDRLGRGEFEAHFDDDNQIMVDIADIRTVLADRDADAASPIPRQQYKARRRTKPRDLAIKLKADPMPQGAERVEPANIDALNACPAGAYIRFNDAYAFILGDGDPHEGAALLRRFERQSNSIIRQPGDQYMKVGKLRAFLKKNGYKGVKGSPWDALT
jgi:hypothetical protein